MYPLSARQAPKRRFALLAALLFMAASLAGGKALWFLSYAMLASLLVSLSHGLLGLLALRGAIRAPSAGIAAGDELTLSYELKNSSPLGFPTIEFFEGGGFTRGEKRSVLLSMEPRATKRWEARVRFERRGKYRYGEAELVIRDIYGLSAVRKRLRSPLAITVYPRVVPLERLRPEGLRRLGELLVGDPFARDLSEVSSLRAYQDGDPLHYLHWRLSARGEEALVKQFARRGDVSIDLVLDSEAAHYAADTDGRLADLGAEAAISLADYLLARGARCRLFLSAGTRRLSVEGASSSALPSFMEALADYDPGDAEGSSSSALASSRARSDNRASIVLIGPTPSRAAALALLQLKLQGRRAAFVHLGRPTPSAHRVEAEGYLAALKAEGIAIIGLDERKELGHALSEVR